jgi:carboxymethylenebutenolidase
VESATVIYGDLAGRPLSGYFTHPPGAAAGRPGVLVFHEWWGLNDNIRRMSDRLAAAGYLVLAVDVYDGKTAETPDQAQHLMQAALDDMPANDANIGSAYVWLKQTAHAGKIASLGWCFGGGMSFEAAQVLGGKLDAVVIYYGFVNGDRKQLARIEAPVLGLFGGLDQSITPETVHAFEAGLRSLGAHPLIHVYPDAGHAFANPSGKNYRKDDAEDAWKRTLDFLAANLK